MGHRIRGASNSQMYQYWENRLNELKTQRPQVHSEKDAEVAKLKCMVSELERQLIPEGHLSASEKIEMAGGRGPALGERIRLLNRERLGDIAAIRHENNLLRNKIGKFEMRIKAISEIKDIPSHFQKYFTETENRRNYYKRLAEEDSRKFYAAKGK